jgi:uncharacterized RDD family membrane protein YckC
VLVDDRITISTPEGVDVELVLAGLGSRVAARLIDALIQGAIIFALAIVGAAVSGVPGGGFVAAGLVIVDFAVIFVYDVLFETLGSGRTPGKRAAGIRVVGLRGQPVSFRASAVRNAIRIVELILLYIPSIISILVTSRDQRLGDLAAGTVVIRETFGGFGGHPLAKTPAPLTVPIEAVADWDVSAVTPDEVLAIRTFLDRRTALPWHIRSYLAGELLTRIAPKVTGLPASAHPEYILEGIVIAKHARA